MDGAQRAGSRARRADAGPGRPLTGARPGRPPTGARPVPPPKLLLAALALLAAAAAPAPRRPLKLLFIGNSLTYANDLPALVAGLAEGAGEAVPVYDAVVEGGFSLEDHWIRGAAQRAIARGGWDFVVLQQGPSASYEGRQSLARDSKRFAEIVRKAGGRPALYMVWPSQSRHGDFAGVVDSYRAAARGVDAVLFPVGEAWRIAEKSAPEIALYSKDGLHPTVEGSYLAAAVIVGRLYGRSPRGLPSLGLPDARARALQDAAAEALRSDPAGPPAACAPATEVERSG